MTAFIIKRILWMIPTVILISIIAFTVIELPPGDYLTSYVVALQASGAEVDASIIASLERQYGLNQPVHVRYLRWVENIIFRGNFGMSWNYNRPVRDLVMERLPMTVAIALGSLLFMYAVAIPIGIYSAFRQYSPVDHFFTTIGFLGLSIPKAQRATRLPTGHPEAFIEAFANVYKNAADTIRAKGAGREPTELERDFPTVYDGARGVHFIEKTVESSKSDRKWLAAGWRKTG